MYGDRAFTLVCYILLRLGLVSFALLSVSLIYCFRNRMRYEMVRSVLYYNGKKVVKQSDVTKRVKYEYITRRGHGLSVCTTPCSKEDVCLSENAIIHVLSRDGQHQNMTARFVDRAERPIRTLRVQECTTSCKLILLTCLEVECCRAMSAEAMFMFCVSSMFSADTCGCDPSKTRNRERFGLDLDKFWKSMGTLLLFNTIVAQNSGAVLRNG